VNQITLTFSIEQKFGTDSQSCNGIIQSFRVVVEQTFKDSIIQSNDLRYKRWHEDFWGGIRETAGWNRLV